MRDVGSMGPPGGEEGGMRRTLRSMRLGLLYAALMLSTMRYLCPSIVVSPSAGRSAGAAGRDGGREGERGARLVRRLIIRGNQGEKGPRRTLDQ